MNTTIKTLGIIALLIFIIICGVVFYFGKEFYDDYKFDKKMDYYNSEINRLEKEINQGESLLCIYYDEC